MTKRVIFYILACLVFFLQPFMFRASAKEVVILYTGDTHAMLYPCSCPIEPDGGVARRSSLVNQLRKNNPDTLLLDSGNFFAGGAMDDYSQNIQMDQERTRVQLKAMELMQYDAAAFQDDEFNFGINFLEENLLKSKIAFLSGNLSSGNPQLFRRYIIKEVGGTKVGITTVTTPVVINKGTGLQFIDPEVALKQIIPELKTQGAALIIVLSHLDANDEERLIKGIPGIDVLIGGHAGAKEKSSQEIASTILVRPDWQGRRLGKLSLTLKNDKIINYKVDELRLSDRIKDDSKVSAILPQCFRNADCKKEGQIGACQRPGTVQAQCFYARSAAVNLLIVTSRECHVCDTEAVIKRLKTAFPGLVVSYLYYPDAKAAQLVKDSGAEGLPLYLMDKEVEKDPNFNALRRIVELKGNFYAIKPEFSGISYFLNRQKIKGKLDLFISLYEKDTAGILEAIKDFRPAVHFLAIEQEGALDAAKGREEVEEYLRSVCVQKYYPAYFWDYITCRAKNINSTWWEDCLGDFDASKIKVCSKDKEGVELLRENIQLNKEIHAIFGPVYLLDNQESFGTQGVPTKEGYKKIFRR